MINPIQGVPLPPSGAMIHPASVPAGINQSGTDQKGSFAQMMLDSLSQVNQMQQDADAVVGQFFTGGEVNPGQVLTSVQKADMSFRMMLQIRNKLVDAWNKIEDIRI